jgi:hypothetical protein
LGSLKASASDIKKVFVIALENHNWTQPVSNPGGIQPVFNNPINAPFIYSLVNGTATAVINGATVNISQQTSYAKAYYNALATPTGNNPSIHPSEPNYLWAEAGTNFGVLNDNDPFASSGGTNQNTVRHLSGFLQVAGRTWRSYQEDADLLTTGMTNMPGMLTNTPLPRASWTVPATSFSGNFVSGFNAYNGSSQYNYATKHNPMAYFTDTNGGPNFGPSNPLSQSHAPLQQLQFDLASNTVADYNWITPNQYNDMHTALSASAPIKGTEVIAGFTGDGLQIKQGDDFLKQLVPMIMASQAYRDHGVIIIWTDETEPAGAGDTPSQNDFQHTLAEIVISADAHANVNGLPYGSPVVYTHSSDLLTMQEIFGVGPAIGDAANATDLSDLFNPGVISDDNVNVKGNLTISAGQSITLSQGAVVNGNVMVNGGTLFLTNGSRIGGNLQVSSGDVTVTNSTVGGNAQFNGGSFSIGSGTVIQGNLQANGLPGGSAILNLVCGASIGGNLQYQNNAGAAVIGGPTVLATSTFASCPGNVVNGNMQVDNNSSQIQVYNNKVKNNLQCQQNSSIQGGGDTARNQQGQCSAF